MAKQKPPNSAGKLTGFPYKDLWEEFGEPGERLPLDGLQREQIRRSFARARTRRAADLNLTKAAISKTLAPLALGPLRERELTETLYVLAGHYYSPRFHRLFGDTPADVRLLLRKVASTSAKLNGLMSAATEDVWHYVDGARWHLGETRRGDPYLKASVLQNHIADLADAARTVAEEFPKFGRGTTEKVLLGRWLRQSAEAIEQAAGQAIRTKTRDSAGPNYRFEGVIGAVFEAYCNAVDASLARKTLVRVVRAYQRPSSPQRSS